MNQEDNKSRRREPNGTQELLDAITSVILELADILSDYRDAFVVSGGLALHLLFLPRGSLNIVDASGEEEVEPYGRLTKDVDLILNVWMLKDMFDDSMPTISELLIGRNYHK